MRILAANLKHLYQRRSLWLVYLFLTSSMVVSVLAASSSLVYLFPLLLGVGLVLGSCQREVASRPFSFLLPRHTGVAPRQALLQGALFAAVASLCWFVLPQPMPSQHLGLLGAVWLLGTACYMAGAVLGFVLPLVFPILGWLFLPFAASRRLTTQGVLCLAIRERLGLAALLALGMIVWSWWRLGRRSLTRRWSGRRTLSLLDEFSPAKRTQYRQWRKTNKGSRQPERGSGPVAPSCIKGIRHSRPEGVLLYWHAVRSEWLGATTGRGYLNALGIGTVFLLVMGYSGDGRRSAVLFVMLANMANGLRRIHATTLLSIGRRQRYALAVVSVLLLTALSAGMAYLLIALSHAVAPLMPPITRRGAPVPFQPFPYVYALIPTVLTPLAFAGLAWRKGRTGVVMLIWMPLFVVALLVPQALWGMSLAVWFALPFVSMLASLGVLRYHCLRRDIV